MNCRQFLDRHCAFVDDTVSGVELAELRTHLAECRYCADHDARVRRALLLVRNLPPIALSEGFRARLDARLRTVIMAPEQVRTRPVFPLFAAAAVLLVALGYSTRQAAARREAPLTMPPVVASWPEPDPSPLVSPAVDAPAIVASLSTGLAVWPVALVAEQAPVYFVNAALSETNLTR